MSIVLQRRSSYSLFPSCTDPLPQHSSYKNTGCRLGRRISRSREATDISLCHGGVANDQRRNDMAVNKSLKQPAMVRMIPFKLQASRPSSTSSLPTTTPSISSPITPRKPRPGPVTDLIIVPYTQEDWRAVMEEVKILYLKGQYKHCSMRCQQLLNTKDSVSLMDRSMITI
jgi:hypothetical protein